MSKQNKSHLIWFTVIILLMIIGTIWDYQINVWLSNYTDNIIVSLIYRFFKIFGEFIFLLAFIMFFGLFFNFGLRKKSSVRKWLQVSINGVGLITFTCSQFLSLEKNLFLNIGTPNEQIALTSFFVSIILSIILAYIINKLMSKIKDSQYSYFKRIAWLTITYVVTVTVIVNLIEFILVRPRFWFIEEKDITFVSWFTINGTGQEELTSTYKSLVSGYTANAFSAIYISLWFPKKKEKLFSIFMACGLLTALSRIFAGQDYLTSVTMGGFLAFTLFILLTKIYKIDKVYKKVVTST